MPQYLLDFSNSKTYESQKTRVSPAQLLEFSAGFFSWPLSAAEGKTASSLNSQVNHNKNSVVLAFALMHLQYHLSPSYEAANFLSVHKFKYL